MTTAIERHARAYDPVGWCWYDSAPDDHPAKPIFRKRAMQQSRAAIEAMREPTEAMCEVGGDRDVGGSGDQYPVHLYEDVAEAVWTAMIDAILEEG